MRSLALRRKTTCEKHDLVQSGKSSLMSCPDIKLIPQTNSEICLIVGSAPLTTFEIMISYLYLVEKLTSGFHQIYDKHVLAHSIYDTPESVTLCSILLLPVALSSIANLGFCLILAATTALQILTFNLLLIFPILLFTIEPICFACL